ncbi:MAG: DNA repair and recombination protein RadB [Candidatus Woesearchaeota archaeon]
MKQSTGSQVFDDLLEGGFESGVLTTIYGPPGSGKTNITMLAAATAAEKKKVIYIDTEGGFSVERLRQLTKNSTKVMGRILFLRPTTFQQLKADIAKLDTIMSKQVGMVIVDSIAMLYRTELAKDAKKTNQDLAQQVNQLVSIARTFDIPVLATNQVYADMEIKGQVNMVGGDILRYASKCIIELRKDEKGRTAILKKHRSIQEKKKVFFLISQDGIVLDSR